MGLVETRRRNTQYSIAQNPTIIEIKRTIKRRKDGYIDEEVLTIPPQTVRIFNASGSPQQILTLAGEKQTDRHYGMLADYQADIQAGTEVQDEFIHRGERHLVKAVWPQTIHGQIVGYQCELERVK